MTSPGTEDMTPSPGRDREDRERQAVPETEDRETETERRLSDVRLGFCLALAGGLYLAERPGTISDMRKQGYIVSDEKGRLVGMGRTEESALIQAWIDILGRS